MQGYCVKCRAKKEMKNAKGITMKNGKPATQGTCPTCGTKMFRIGKGQTLTQGVVDDKRLIFSYRPLLVYVRGEIFQQMAVT